MKRIKEWYLRTFKKQHNFIYCNCGNELISSNIFCTTKDERVYKYKCSKCNEISYWLFDTPVPIKIESRK